MKIKNEYIKIKQGNKEIKLNNYIYDDYLSLFSTTQYDEGQDIEDLYEKQKEKAFYNCFVRFDEPLEDITNAQITDFEVYGVGSKTNFIKLKNGVNVIYNYFFNEFYDIYNPGTFIDKDEYYGKQITTLGFGRNGKIYACLDVSNYEIYIIEDENLTITRKDNILSEAICYGYDFPVHLSPFGDFENALYNETSLEFENKYAKLYSVGFAKTAGVMSEELIIGDDINIKVIDDTKFSFNLKKGDAVSLYPQNDLYAGSDVYPLPLYVQHEFYPQNDLYASNDLYPSDSNYKYIVYKFRLYTIHWLGPNISDGLEIQELDEYYTMFLENTTKGLFEIITKIERNDE